MALLLLWSGYDSSVEILFFLLDSKEGKRYIKKDEEGQIFYLNDKRRNFGIFLVVK